MPTHSLLTSAGGQTSRYLLPLLLTAGQLLAALGAQAQCAMGPPTPVTFQVTNITATTATVTLSGSLLTASQPCPTLIRYTYAGGSPVSVPYAMPLLLTGLPPSAIITLTVTRYLPNPNPFSNPQCCSYGLSSVSFTTAGGPLAAALAAVGSTLTLAPNPARTSTTLTLAAPLPAPAPVQVLDALGREVRRLPLPTRAATAALDLAGLPPGLYLVRVGGSTARLVVE